MSDLQKRWKKEKTGGNGNSSVNKENSSCCFFHVLIGASQGAPPLSLFLFFVLFPFLFLCSLLHSSRREKEGRRGTQRQFEHRHSVYIYQNFFAFDRAIAIKMCSCNCGGLGNDFFLAEFATPITRAFRSLTWARREFWRHQRRGVWCESSTNVNLRPFEGCLFNTLTFQNVLQKHGLTKAKTNDLSDL